MNKPLQAIVAAVVLVTLAVVGFILIADDGRAGGDAAVIAPVPGAAEEPATAELTAPGARRTAVPVEDRAAERPEGVARAPVDSAGLVLAGRVTMVDGRGLSMVSVEVPDLGLKTVSRAGGSFAFEGLPAGEHRLAIAPVGGREGYPIVGPDTFPAGATDVELVLTASLLRVRAQTEDGEPATFGSVGVDGIGDDGQCYSLGTRMTSRAMTTTDLVVPAGTNLRVLATGDGGTFAALVQTPAIGGAVEAVLRPDAVGLSTLTLDLVGLPPTVQGGYLDVMLVNESRGDVVVDGFPLAPTIRINGLLSGEYRLALAVVHPEGTAAQDTLTVVEPTHRFDLVGDATRRLTVDLQQGGRLEVELVGDLSGIPPQALPADVSIEVTPMDGGEPLELRWRSLFGGAATQRPGVGMTWTADRSLAPGEYSLRAGGMLFDEATATARVVAGERAEVRIDLARL